MYLIVGLGNPENDYSKTRHNMGFNVINELANKCGIQVNKSKFEALYGTGVIEKEKVILVKPQTYMNLSGISVQKFKNFYKLENENIIIIYDDMDIQPGKIKIRKKGGPGSHNGMKSVVELLGADNFPRIRVGIGKPENKQNMIEYVIGHVEKEELDILDEGVKKACMATNEILKNGIDIAMNIYN